MFRTLLQRPVITTTTTTANKIYPFVVGHRGALYDRLENTRAGFLLCATDEAYQCDAVELDVFILPNDNNKVVVYHGMNDDTNPGELQLQN